MKKLKEILKNYNPQRKEIKYEKNEIKLRKIATYRFQDLMANCLDEFSVKGNWRNVAFGKISNWIKHKGEESVNWKLEKIKTIMNEKGINSPRYFIKMLGHYFNINKR